MHRKEVWIDIHQLRAWRSGNFVHIDLHLVLPRDYLLDDAHAQAKALEQLLIEHFEGNAGVLVHMDPCGTILSDGKAVACWENCSERTIEGQGSGQDSVKFVKRGIDK